MKMNGIQAWPAGELRLRIQTRLPLMLALTALVSGCSRSGGDGIPADAPLTVYMWSEYIDPSIPGEFEKTTGRKVRIDVYESTEEMEAKLRQSAGAGQYDVVVASDHEIPVLVKLGLIQPLDLDKIPNRANLDGRFKSPGYDPDSRYSLPYQWGSMGLMYRRDRIPELEASWGVLFQGNGPAGPFVLIDSVRDMLAAALKHGGHSVNSRDPQAVRAAGERVLAAKNHPRCLGFAGGVGGKNKVVSGDATLAVVYNGDALRAIEEEPNAAFVIPREGSIIWVDAMTITAGTRQADAAHAFINYILDPAVGAKLSNFNRYATPNAAALPLIDPEDRANPAIYPPEELMAKLEYLEELGEATRLYDEVWTSVKSR